MNRPIEIIPFTIYLMSGSCADNGDSYVYIIYIIKTAERPHLLHLFKVYGNIIDILSIHYIIIIII